ncbi:MAG TPA: CDP-archaeol synthase [Steroidobacteraceae bacterium]|nr:CDP-archaeol synthase [Steroidobacteraceae bacterium]
MFDEFRALVLLVAANAVPVVVARLSRGRWAAPLDFGCVLADGERLFGSHKTWRGLLSGIAAGAAVSLVLDVMPVIGAGFACASLLADATSSAVKRRMHLKPGTEYLGIDQIGEALVPLGLFATPLSLQWSEVFAVTAIFTVLDVATARFRHRASDAS